MIIFFCSITFPKNISKLNYQEKNYKNITVAMLGGLDAAKSNDITYNDIARFCDWMNKRYKSTFKKTEEKKEEKK